MMVEGFFKRSLKALVFSEIYKGYARMAQDKIMRKRLNDYVVAKSMGEEYDKEKYAGRDNFIFFKNTFVPALFDLSTYALVFVYGTAFCWGILQGKEIDALSYLGYSIVFREIAYHSQYSYRRKNRIVLKKELKMVRTAEKDGRLVLN